jgi:hypothetical protein
MEKKLRIFRQTQTTSDAVTKIKCIYKACENVEMSYIGGMKLKFQLDLRFLYFFCFAASTNFTQFSWILNGKFMSSVMKIANISIWEKSGVDVKKMRWKCKKKGAEKSMLVADADAVGLKKQKTTMYENYELKWWK